MTNKLTVNANSKMIISSQVMESSDFLLESGKKVLGMTAVACVTGCEALNAELRVAVRTIFRLMYAADGGVGVVEQRVDNTHSIAVSGMTASTKAVVKANVVDCDYIDGNIVKGNATIAINGWYLVENSMQFLDCCQSDIFCKTDTIKVENVNLLPVSTLSLTNTFEARMPLSNILDSKCSVNVINVYAMNGAYQIEGEINLRVVALTDNNQFISQTFLQPFNTEISHPSMTVGSVIDIEGSITDCQLTLTDTDSRTIISDIVVLFESSENTTSEVMGIVDAYSITNEIDSESSCLRLNTCYCYRTVRDKASINVAVENTINEVCCVMTPMVSGNINTNGGNVVVEGLVTSTVVCTDENNNYNSMIVELPYQALVASDFECDTHMQPMVEVSNINVRLRTSKEVEASAELLISVRGVSSQDICLITQLEKGQVKEQNDYAISLYIVKSGQTMWDVAKALNTDENTILALNSELKLPLKGGEKVLIYKPIDIEF